MKTPLASLLLLVSTFSLQANDPTPPIYPISDLRVQDASGDGFGDQSFAEDSTHDTLNLGDNPNDQTWRSIVKFDLASHAEAIKSAGQIQLQLTVKNRLIQIPKNWKLEIVTFPSDFAEKILISPKGDGNDDYSKEGTEVYSAAAGTINSGGQLLVDITDVAKAALESGVLALRLQLDPASNKDQLEDQMSFYAGSHDVNSPHLRPQLIINP